MGPGLFQIGGGPQNGVDLPVRRFKSLAGVDDEMRARAFLSIRDLFGDYGGERLRRHPGTGENPRLLH